MALAVEMNSEPVAVGPGRHILPKDDMSATSTITSLDSHQPQQQTSEVQPIQAQVILPLPTSSVNAAPAQQSQQPVEGKRARFATTTTKVYDEDAGIIRCICGFDDDDGFTIQCERCYVWQHAVCVDISKENVPEIYFCDQCGSRKVNAAKAKELQKKRLSSENGSANGGSSPTAGSVDTGSGPGSSPLSNNVQTTRQTRRNTKKKRTPSEDAATAATNNSAAATNGDEKSDETPATTRKTGRGGRRMTVQNSKVHNTEQDSDVEPDSRYYLSSAAYRSYYLPITGSKIPRAIEKFWSQVPDICLKYDDLCTGFTQKEMDGTYPAKVKVKLVDSQARNKFTGFSKYGLFLESPVVKNRYVIEFVGEVMTMESYKLNTINQYRLFGCPKPGVLFLPLLNLVIDGRRMGNEASFIRRSCKPNLKFSSIVVDEHSVRYGGFALEALKSGSELTVAWDWDPKHPAARVADGVEDEAEYSESERQCLQDTAEIISQRGMDCACGEPGECVLTHMKRIGSTTEGAATGTSPRATRSSAEGYSEREERKLKGAMAMIEKLEREDTSTTKKRKRASDTTAPSSPPPSSQATSHHLRSPGSAASEPQFKSPTASKSIQTDPIVKRQRSISALTPRQSLLNRFLKAKQEVRNRQASAPSPSPPTVSPTLSLSNEKIFVDPTQIPSSTDIVPSPPLTSPAATFPTTHNSPPVVAHRLETSPPIRASLSLETPLPTPAVTNTGSSLTNINPLFAKSYTLDQKQRMPPPASDITSSTSGRSGSTTPTTPLANSALVAMQMPLSDIQANGSIVNAAQGAKKKKLSLADYMKKQAKR